MYIKMLVAIAFTLICSISNAASSDCELKTNIEEELQTITVELSDSGHGSMTNFETQDFKGILASSKGYLVVGITIKETNQSMSFHGDTSTAAVGGQLIDGDNWIQIRCK
ncbi:hypothetical protein [Halobacteriovorax sp.]|uniref:hypothetical protein n=1 Tax=Halobacteriovorax sp. TaxID=2020862 RepID=UPI0035616EE6